MARRPRFEVVDDPLALSADGEPQPERADPGTRGRGAAPAARKSPRPRSQAGAKPSARTKAEPRRPPAGDVTPQDALWDPPPLDEPLTLVATRLPSSLDRALDEHTRQLRRRDGASQKRLPKQDVLALAVWALGDPDDEQARARLEALYDQYRGRRLAAAGAAALGSTRRALPED